MNIVVLCGGLSGERDVSISSGTGAANALRQLGHNTVLIDLYLGYTEPFEKAAEVFAAAGELEAYRVGETVPDLETVKALRPDDGHRVGPNVLELCMAADITFMALHGEDGENGKVQAMLDLYGVKYTGCGYLGSALAMNKSLSKTVFHSLGIASPEGVTLDKAQAREYLPPDYPRVVKPCSGGSSVGTSIVANAGEYAAALELAFRYEEKVIVERFIKGRELTVGVMDGEAMPVIEVVPNNGFYSYKSKYQAGAALEICPAQIGARMRQRVQRLAERVARALMIDAYCRVDFLWEPDSDEIYCLEANTLPGMTPTSLIPQMAAAMDMDYGRLCEKIIEVSMKKYEK